MPHLNYITYEAQNQCRSRNFLNSLQQSSTRLKFLTFADFQQSFHQSYLNVSQSKIWSNSSVLVSYHKQVTLFLKLFHSHKQKIVTYNDLHYSEYIKHSWFFSDEQPRITIDIYTVLQFFYLIRFLHIRSCYRKFKVI